MELCEADIQPELDRRRPGTSRHVTQRKEDDTVEILSGVFEGRTTGTPIAPADPQHRPAQQGLRRTCSDTFRPGHADYTYQHKYGLRDPRGGGRASARLTAPTVGAARDRAQVAARALRHDLRRPHDGRSATIAIPFEGVEHVAEQPVLRRQRERHRTARGLRRRAEEGTATAAARASTSSRAACRSASGEPLYDKLDADIAHAMMGINAVKGVEIGAGFAVVAQRGTTHGDELTPEGFREQQRRRRARRHLDRPGHHASRIAIKPTSSIRSAAPLDRPRRQGDDGRDASAATTPASASARRRSPRRCWRWC